MKDETYEQFRESAAAYAKTHPFARMPLRPLGAEREGYCPDPPGAALPCLSSDTIRSESRISDPVSCLSTPDNALVDEACRIMIPPNSSDLGS